MSRPRHIPSQLRRPTGWLPATLLAYHHLGYPAVLWAWARLGGPQANPAATLAGEPGKAASRRTVHADDLPPVAYVIAAHDEADVIGAKVSSTAALDYPRDRLRIVVACDGCTDDTAAVARAAGADLVLELPRGGKMAAQHAAVAAVDEPIVAFSDANSTWDADALHQLVDALAEPGTGYACGRVRFVQGDAEGGDNQEGVYWRYEMAIRSRESALASVTAGNGAIYAIRRAAYSAYAFDPVMGHDLAMPFQLVRAGWRAVDVPSARAWEKMVPTIDGEFRRKRRMMSHAWPIVLQAGMLDLRGLPTTYSAMLVSHRWLRYGGPLLHLWLGEASLRGARRSRIARLLVAGQLAVLVLAARPQALPAGPVRRIGLLARYYVATTAAIALGLRDHLIDGTEASWTPPEGTR
ncbi:MAG: glycosyltransferase [Solirubrobacteraceae bacterium]|nr:glycosyltransferase [Solirubrobacteraceae bacterium]